MPDSYWSLDGAIDALVAGLKARSGLSGIQVSDCWPGELQEAKSVWVDDANSSDEIAGMRSGPAKSNESYSIFVVCDAYVEGGTAKNARDALTTLVGEVMREIAEKKRLTTADNKVLSARVAGWKFRPYVLKEGRGCAAKVEIRILGRR